MVCLRTFRVAEWAPVAQEPRRRIWCNMQLELSKFDGPLEYVEMTAYRLAWRRLAEGNWVEIDLEPGSEVASPSRLQLP